MFPEQLSEKTAVLFLRGYFEFRNLYVVQKFIHYMFLESVVSDEGFEVFVTGRSVNQHVKAD